MALTISSIFLVGLYVSKAMKNESEAVEIEGDPILMVEKNEDETRKSGSDILEAALNLTNSIVGAGCIGFGAAMARSGGLTSIVSMIFFAYLNKVSFDMLIDLAVTTGGSQSSYEELGWSAYGASGRLSVVLSKGVYSFGSLIAYIKIFQDNFAPATRHWAFGNTVTVVHHGVLGALLFDDKVSTIFLCATVMLPLCLLRDITPLARFSALKIGVFVMLILIVVYLYGTTDRPTPTETVPTQGDDWRQHWLTIRPGFVQSMGTFVFTFIAQHTVHLVYGSLKPEKHNSTEWRKVSSMAMTLSVLLCFPIGLFVYMTFWENTSSNLFLLYVPSKAADTARILLCLVMLLTYPMSFFSCREVIILSLPSSTSSAQPRAEDRLPGEMDELIASRATSRWFLPGSDRQLLGRYHVALTVGLWLATLVLALAAPSLGDILNLVGCALGTLIAFVLPAMFSYRLQGFSWTAALLFVVGGLVGLVGTFDSLRQLVADMHS